MMTEKSLFSSDAMQFRIEKLLEEGRVTEAAALMTQEMAKQVGGAYESFAKGVVEADMSEG